MTVDTSADTPRTDTDSPQGTGGASTPQLPVTRYVYLQGAIASMSTGFDVNISNVARHDVVLRLTTRGESFDVEMGGYRGQVAAVVIPPLQRYSVRSRGPGLITYSLQPVHPRFRTARTFLDGSPRLLDHALFAHLAGRMDDACSGRLSVDAGCDLMDDLLGVLLCGVEPAPPLDLRIPWVMRKLDVNIDHPFEQLAEELGLSTSRLSHLFSEQLGLSFRGYQAWARLRQAWEMLDQHPEMSITDVARAMGYADGAHLSRTFHSSFGFTPSALRDSRYIQVVNQGLPPGLHIPSDEEMGKS